MSRSSNCQKARDLVDEATAEAQHHACMTYQGAKAKYRETVKGRGVDQAALEQRSQERLRLAKQRSFCAACKGRGHWHKDPVCLFRGQRDDYVKPEKDTSEAKEAHLTVHTVQLCENVNECYMASNLVDENANLVDENAHENVEGNSLMAIINTACTRTVAGYRWFEDYVKSAGRMGIDVHTVDIKEHFKYGASKVFTSLFAVKAWVAIVPNPFAILVAIVPCNVFLLFSRPVFGSFKMCYTMWQHRK